jgi:CBS domain-containing protein
MKVVDVMTRNVISVGIDAPITEAVQLMLENRISGLPVLDREGCLAGVVTEGDFLRRAETGTEKKRPRWIEFLLGVGLLAEDYVRTHGRRVVEIMTSDPVTVFEDTPLDEVVPLMERHRIKRMPVVRGRRVVGIISRANLLHALASIDIPSGNASDAAVRDKILADLERQPWAPNYLNVLVRNGVVDLFGAVVNENERNAVRVLVENVEGVKVIKDHLVWIESVSGAPFMPA